MSERNARLMDIRAGELQRTHSPAFAWKTSGSIYQSLPCLRGYWGMGSRTIVGSTIYVCSQGGQAHLSHDLTLVDTNGIAVFGYESLIPWATMYGTDGGGSTYLTTDSSPDTLEITGGETYIDDPGLTVGAWWKFDNDVKTEGLMSKESGAPDISWFVAKTGASTIQFSCSANGTATASAFSTNTIDTTAWHLAICRYDPGAEMVVFLDGVKGAPVVAGIPATLHDTSADFEIGNNATGFNQNDYKKVSHAFICASRLSDALCQAIWHHTRAMYGQ